MAERFHVVPEEKHRKLVAAAYRRRGFSGREADDAARLATEASRHGIRTHNALKALHLDDLFGSRAGGCVPRAKIERIPVPFRAAQVWNANLKLGQSTAYEAIERAMKLADRYGIGMVSVDNAFHYLWGGGYVLEAARRGYVAYTNCTAALAEVVPFGGRHPTLGTNPHSWGLPTTEAIGFPVVIDWATSVVAMGRVQQLAREGATLPPGVAVDSDGNPTTDPAAVRALLPFGAHKGFGLALLNELVAAFIGGSLPTLRCRTGGPDGEKRACSFFFQVWKPEAMSGGAFALGRKQSENVKAVLADIRAHGNEGCLLPGEPESRAAARCERNGGLLFSAAEIEGFDAIAASCRQPRWRLSDFQEAAA
jgi:LDH2 family malate/lactate/ureidoglycolate dehydrogenase